MGAGMISAGRRRSGGGPTTDSVIASAHSTADLTISSAAAGTLMFTPGGGLTVREIGNVQYDPDDVSYPYKLLYSAHTGAYAGTNVYLYLAHSADGLTWSDLGQLTDITRAAEDPWLMKIAGKWWIFCEDKQPATFRNIRAYSTAAGAALTASTTFTDHGDVVTYNASNAWEAQDVSSPVVWIDGSTIHMLYESRTTGNIGSVSHATAALSDPTTWAKDGANPILTQSAFAWCDSIVPDDIAISTDGDYVLYMHGELDYAGATDIAGNNVPGIATGASITTLADAIGHPAIADSDGTIMAHRLNDQLVYTDGTSVYRASSGQAVILDLTFVGSNGSTTYTESSDYARTYTSLGNAQIQSNKLELDGTGDYVYLTNKRWFDYAPNTLTVEMTGLVLDSVGIDQRLCAAYFSTDGRRGWYIAYFPGAGGGLNFRMFPTGNSASIVTVAATGGISAGVAFDLKCEWDGSTIKIYVNGVQQASTAYTSALTPLNEPISIGSWNIGGAGGAAPAQFLNGRVQRVKVSVS